jgi:AcrR family transcriptional regulator
VPESEPDRETGTSRAEQRRRTERRILAAASRLFVEAGYERTTIRAVAQAAGVDPGLVMHYFDSKRELFRRVTEGAPVPRLGGTPGEVTEQILAHLAGSLENEPVQSLAVLRSMLTNPEAAQVISVGANRYQAQVSRSIPAADADVRAALISALILGVVVSRYLLESPGLAGAAPQQLIDLLRPGLRSLMAAGEGPEGRSPE